MIYQSFSGDAETGTGNFVCSESSIEIVSSSSYYSTAPMFFVTNTKANIALEGCQFTYGSNIFLSAKGTNAWGKSGSNGGDVTLTLTNENIEGNFVLDKISTLSLKLVNIQQLKVLSTVTKLLKSLPLKWMLILKLHLLEILIILNSKTKMLMVRILLMVLILGIINQQVLLIY